MNFWQQRGNSEHPVLESAPASSPANMALADSQLFTSWPASAPEPGQAPYSAAATVAVADTGYGNVNAKTSLGHAMDPAFGADSTPRHPDMMNLPGADGEDGHDLDDDDDDDDDGDHGNSRRDSYTHDGAAPSASADGDKAAKPRRKRHRIRPNHNETERKRRGIQKEHVQLLGKVVPGVPDKKPSTTCIVIKAREYIGKLLARVHELETQLGLPLSQPSMFVTEPITPCLSGPWGLAPLPGPGGHPPRLDHLTGRGLPGPGPAHHAPLPNPQHPPHPPPQQQHSEPPYYHAPPPPPPMPKQHRGSIHQHPLTPISTTVQVGGAGMDYAGMAAGGGAQVAAPGYPAGSMQATTYGDQRMTAANHGLSSQLPTPPSMQSPYAEVPPPDSFMGMGNSMGATTAVLPSHGVASHMAPEVGASYSTATSRMSPQHTPRQQQLDAPAYPPQQSQQQQQQQQHHHGPANPPVSLSVTIPRNSHGGLYPPLTSAGSISGHDMLSASHCLPTPHHHGDGSGSSGPFTQAALHAVSPAAQQHAPQLPNMYTSKS